MRRTAIVLVGVVWMSLGMGTPAWAQEVAPTDTQENLSAARVFGVGIQVDFPWGGLISGRYWLSPSIGAEGVLFVWGDVSGYEGSATVRALFRVADAPVVDFYGATGVTIPFSIYGENRVLFSAAGGIEFGFRFARNLAWNIEFGISYSSRGEMQMVVGTGVHFYF